MRKRILFSFLSGILLIFSFPNFLNLKQGFWFFAWVGFVPLFFSLQGISRFKSFFISYFTGFIFWLGTIYWLIHVSLLGLLLLVTYLSFYFGIFGFFVYRHLTPENFSLLKIASIWVILEYIRSKLFTGFGWANLSYSQYLNLPIIQIADITGSWGVSFLIILINTLIYTLLRWGFKRILKEFIVVLIFVIFSLTYGWYKIFVFKPLLQKCDFKVAVIQPNIPQQEKWNPLSKEAIFNTHLKLTEEAKVKHPNLIIWPEASLPIVLEEGKENKYLEIIKNFVKENRINLLFGAVMFKNGHYYNSAFLVSDERTFQYDKLHLVPFGEYIPLKGIFGFLDNFFPIGDFSPGKDWTIFNLWNKKCKINFSVLICFEDLFPELSKEFVRRGANFLVNITNDAWFKKTCSPYQHFSASVFRAVENRVYLVRSANTGISGFISPTGEISLVEEGKKNIFIYGYKAKDLEFLSSGLSFYTRYPEIFILIAIFILIYERILKIFLTKLKLVLLFLRK